MDDTTTTSSSSSSGHTSRVQKPHHIPIRIQTVVPARQISTTTPNVSTVRIQGFKVDESPNDYENTLEGAYHNVDSKASTQLTDSPRPTRNSTNQDINRDIKADRHDYQNVEATEFTVQRVPRAISIQLSQPDVPVRLATEEETEILPTTSTHAPPSVAPDEKEKQEKKPNIFRASLDKLRDKSRSLTKSDSKDGHKSRIPLAKGKEKKSVDAKDELILQEGERSKKSKSRDPKSSENSEKFPLFDEDDTRRDSVQTAFNIEAGNLSDSDEDPVIKTFHSVEVHPNPAVSTEFKSNFTVVSPRNNIFSVSPRNSEIKLNPLTSLAIRQIPPITVSQGDDTDIAISVHENCSEEAEISTRIVMDKNQNIRSASDVEIEVRREITTDVGPSTTAHLRAPNSRRGSAVKEEEKPKKQKPKLIRLDLNKSNPVHYGQESDDIIHESPKYVVAQPEDFAFALEKKKSPSPKATTPSAEPLPEEVMVLRNKTTDDIIVLRKTDGDKYDTVSLASNDQLILRDADNEEVMVLRREKRKVEESLEVIVEEDRPTLPKRTKSASPARDFREFKNSIKKLVTRSVSPHKHVEVAPASPIRLVHEETISPNQEVPPTPTSAQLTAPRTPTSLVAPDTPTTPTSPSARDEFSPPKSPSVRSVSPKKSPSQPAHPGPKENYGFSTEPYVGPVEVMTASSEFSKDEKFFEATTVPLGKSAEVGEVDFIRKNRSVLRFDSMDKGADSGLKTVDVNVYEDENELVLERRIEVETTTPEEIIVKQEKLVLEVHKEPVEEPKKKIEPAEDRYDELDQQSEASYHPDPNVEVRLSPMKEASVEPGKRFLDMSIRVESPPPLPEEEVTLDVYEEKEPAEDQAEVRVYRERYSEAPILPIGSSASFTHEHSTTRNVEAVKPTESELSKARKLAEAEVQKPSTSQQRPSSIEIHRHSEVPLQIDPRFVVKDGDLQPVTVAVNETPKEKKRPLISPVSPEERELLRSHKPNSTSPRPKAIIEDAQSPYEQQSLQSNQASIIYNRNPKLDEDLKHEEQRLDSLSDEVMRQALELNMIDATTPRRTEWKESSVPKNRNSGMQDSVNSAEVVYSPKIVTITQIDESIHEQIGQRNVPLATEEEDDLYNEMRKDKDKIAQQEQYDISVNVDSRRPANGEEITIRRQKEIREIPLRIASPLQDEGKENGYPAPLDVNGIYRPPSEASRSRPRRRPQSPILAPAPRIGAQSPAPSHTSDFSFSPRTLTRINNFNIVMESTHDNDDLKDTVTDNGEVITHHPVFMRDTSKFWYKPSISREEAINILKDKEPGTFVVRDSNSFPGAFGLALKVAQPPAGVERGDGTELVRHFLIEPSAKGVKLKGCNNEPVFGTLAALIYQHSITALALPQKLILPEYDPAQTPEHVNANQALLDRGAACNVTFICSLDTESLTGPEAVRRATNLGLELLGRRQLCAVPVHFKVSAQGITLTDNTRTLFFRRHYPVNSVTFAGIDPDSRTFDNNNTQQLPTTYVRQAPVFGFVARKTPNSAENTCHIFAELDPEQPASAVVRFITNVMMVQARAQQAAISRTTNQ